MTDITPIEITHEDGRLAYTIRARFDERGLTVNVMSPLKAQRWIDQSNYFGEDVGHYEDSPIGVTLLFSDMRHYDTTDTPSLWDLLMTVENGKLLLDVIEDHLNAELGASHFVRLFARAYRTRGDV